MTTEKNTQQWTREQFDAAATKAVLSIADNLHVYVAASASPAELVVLAFLDDHEMGFAPQTRAQVLATLAHTDPAQPWVGSIRAKVWPEVPVLLVREDVGGQRIQTASVVHSAEPTLAPGGTLS